MSELIPLDDVEAARERVVEALQAGHLAVIPTDAGYAIVADAFKPATRRIFAVKRQRRQAPLSVLIRSPRQVGGLALEIPEPAERLMASYWPGPLTLIFHAQEGLTWYLGESEGTVALRMPTDDLALAVIADVGPLAATLASKQGMPLPRTAQEARQQLKEAIAVYVDVGVRVGEPSTIVDARSGRADVLRRGAIPAAHIAQVATGAVGWGEVPQEGARAPGLQPAGSEQAEDSETAEQDADAPGTAEQANDGPPTADEEAEPEHAHRDRS